MKAIFIATFLLLTAFGAYAAEYTAGTKCPAKVNHEPMKNLEYEAGKSTSGYAVAPADEMPPALSADDFKQVNLPLNIPVSDFIDENNINLNTERMELNAGHVTIDAKNGTAAFNGRDITSTEPTLANPDCW